jgi:signal transduction histidine kinase
LVACLLVIEGPDQGKRFPVADAAARLGRDESNAVRLFDQEVSRRHAEVRPGEGQAHRIVDLGSANGTFVNGQPIDATVLHAGDRIQVGSTVLVYEAETPAGPDLTARVDLLSQAHPDDRSAIVRSVAAGPDPLLQAPGAAGQWLKTRLAHLSVMYRATQAISHIDDVEELLPRILQLVFESVTADRAALLLHDARGDLQPKAVRWRHSPPPDERLTISRTIMEHVRQTGQGVITTDAPTDSRFEPSHSIVDFAIREALCVPIQGRHTTLGVLYADAQGDIANLARENPSDRTRFTQEDLMLLVALGHQAGLAIENTRFYQAKIQAERLAAIGQTITTLSHHIKNILQGLRSGSYLIDLGLNQDDGSVIRRGWGIVEKNQAKIYDLVMDMLTFSKEREPCFQVGNLNVTVADVLELMQARAAGLGVHLESSTDLDMPSFPFDPEGIHRALLNIVTNAIEATTEIEGGRVLVTTQVDSDAGTARIVVSDNGPGIAPADLPGLFQPFASTKGTRGTGLGLPVSEKIVREHGGRLEIRSEAGQGATFTVELPLGTRGDDGPLLQTESFGLPAAEP